MVELFEQEICDYDRQSSKGNQLKWFAHNVWYKADYTGYEGLAEYVVSELLSFSNLEEKEYILYQTEEIRYKYAQYRGCISKNFLPDGWSLVTLERLFQNAYGESLSKSIYSVSNHENRLKFLVEQTERLTGLQQFGVYVSKLLTIDALFLNEDRHTHNIAVLSDKEGTYHYCPIFDNGAALLADTTMDYPLHVPVSSLIQNVHAKTFCADFDEQLDIAEKLYGQKVQFSFGEKEIGSVLNGEMNYSDEIKKRVYEILLGQCRKYSYLFHKK